MDFDYSLVLCQSEGQSILVFIFIFTLVFIFIFIFIFFFSSFLFYHPWDQLSFSIFFYSYSCDVYRSHLPLHLACLHYFRCHPQMDSWLSDKYPSFFWIPHKCCNKAEIQESRRSALSSFCESIGNWMCCDKLMIGRLRGLVQLLHNLILQ